MALTVGPAEPAKLPRWGSLLAWTALTYVTVGERVTNDGGKIYQCITAGQTDNAGGPTGTGADILDGAAHWMYVAANAPLWASGAYTVGKRVSSAGNVYQVLAAGGGSSLVAPTGTSRAPISLSDGYTWIFIASATAVDTEPSEGQKDVGWEPGQFPPAQIQNWNQWTIYRWLVWLQAIGELLLDLPNRALTWTVLQTFGDGIVVTRSSVGTAATITGHSQVGGDGGVGLTLTGGAGQAPGGHAGGAGLAVTPGSSSDTTATTPAILATGKNFGAAVDATGVHGPGLSGASSDGPGILAVPNATRGAINIGSRAADPSAPSEGDIYYNSVSHHFFGWNGTVWKQLDN